MQQVNGHHIKHIRQMAPVFASTAQLLSGVYRVVRQQKKIN